MSLTTSALGEKPALLSSWKLDVAKVKERRIGE